MPPDPETQPTSPTLFGLGTMNEAVLNVPFGLEEAEWAALERGAIAMARLQPSFHYKLAERNFQRLEEVHHFVSTTIALGKGFAPADRTMLAESVMTATVNFLSSMHLFLDHQQTSIDRRFGQDSAEFLAFKQATSLAYDTLCGYRFSYQFRNYVLHCGLPINHIRIEAVANPGSLFKQNAKFLLDRDALLEDFSNWKHVKADLIGMEPVFELLPLLSDAIVGIREVNRVSMDVELDRALIEVPGLHAALTRLDNLPGEPIILRYQYGADGGMQLQPRPLNADAIRKLQAILNGEATRESLWKVDKAAISLASLRPDNIQNVFHRDSRGVQIMLSWLKEGGATPAFLEELQRMASEDGNVEPMVTGMVNTTAVFAHMAAAALSTTADLLIAGILDRYSQVDVLAE